MIEYSKGCLQVLSTDELASDSADKIVKVWDIKTGTWVRTLQGHTHRVSCLQVLHTGKLASGSGDKTIRFWR